MSRRTLLILICLSVLVCSLIGVINSIGAPFKDFLVGGPFLFVGLALLAVGGLMQLYSIPSKP